MFEAPKFKTPILEFASYYRAFDNKWEILGKILDKENTYTYTTETKQRISHTPEKWVCVDVLNDVVEVIKKYNLSINTSKKEAA